MNAEGSKRGKASDYHLMADQSEALAKASTLDNVREKHEVAAAKWRNLALLSEPKPEPISYAAPAIQPLVTGN